MGSMAAQARRLFELFVARVPWTLSAKEMREYFSQFGTVKKCVLPFDKETGFHRGYGWIVFSSEEGLQNVLQKDQHIVEGSKLQVLRNRRELGEPQSHHKPEHNADV
ncbi:SRA stem-loop-interacting RNA-binding protein, mitochondrial [Microcaecilia unicolor]|uniref:SRA stem-loop-interacting RNA-binding protein, mitochondrial n=1 Tax=Microcaecilia unicolor TaxID=1415580 RepID=A0A6P7WWF6_9AMPH|nr:SRA stem-loop-interacting RNA-binding protein, mitochondrial-like [Microcaecilia unicolor]XP_030069920.1 SRA stem-loop-interacting RNA-binding protein, mitochondrial [Microcaecilia unicolor]